MKIPHRTDSRLTIACLLSLIGLFLAGCESPVTGAHGEASDSLDAQSGQEKFNSYDFNQGNLFSTGQITDLAIEGRGFFVLKNGIRNVYFRRPAIFFLDADGFLVLGNNKTRLQGIRLSDWRDPEASPADMTGADSLRLQDLTDVNCPFHAVLPPKATSKLSLARNLDAESQGQGSILYTQKFLRFAGNDDRAVGITDQTGMQLGFRAGDRLTFSVRKSSGPNGDTTVASRFLVAESTTLADVATAITAFLGSQEVDAGPGATASVVSLAENRALAGSISIYGNAAAIHGFQVASTHPQSTYLVAKAFAVPFSIPAGAAKLEITTATLRAPARPEDPVGDLLDANGAALGLQNGDQISFGGTLGGMPAARVTPLIVAAGAGGTALQDILAKIRESFNLPDRDGTAGNNPSVSLNAAGTDDNIPDGSIVVRGQPEPAFAIGDVVVRCTDENNASPSPNAFNTGMATSMLRDASESKISSSSISIYDGLGKEHFATIRFSPTPVPGKWTWEIGLAGQEIILAGRAGGLTFGPDGAVASFAFDDGGSRFEFDPRNGSAIVRAGLDPGGPGDFTGLTQFRAPTTAAIIDQDGFPSGLMREISINEDGILSASFTNGRALPLFRLPLADFPNKQGLERVGENSFLQTGESGEPLVTLGGERGFGFIKPGAIEFVTEEEHARLCRQYPVCP